MLFSYYYHVKNSATLAKQSSKLINEMKMYLIFADMSSGFCATPNFSATALNHHSHHQIAAAAHAVHHPSSLHHNGGSGGGSHMGMGNLGGSATSPAVALTAAAVLDTTCFLGPG